MVISQTDFLNIEAGSCLWTATAIRQFLSLFYHIPNNFLSVKKKGGHGETFPSDELSS